jgi:DNA-binding transcriptional regulator YiaG
MTPADLVAWRERMGLSKSAAAAALGCHRNALANWEKGAYPPPPYIALACDALEAARGKKRKAPA